jgi:NitT/TauT family transport system substrate-binding protein
MRSSRTAAWIITSIVLALTLSTCRKEQSSPSTTLASAAEEPATVRLGYSALRIGLPIFVAAERGFFRDEGLDVKLQTYDTSQPMTDDLVSGRLDAAGYTAFPITFAAQARTKVRLKYLTEIYEDSTHPISVIVVPKGSTVKRLRDLKGKSIGILPTVAYRRWLIAAMQKDGLAETDYRILNIEPALSGSALSSGQIAALFSGDPAITAVKRATGAIDPFGESVTARYLQNPFPFGSFSIREDFAAQHPKAVEKIARALDRAIEFIRTNPAEAKLTMRNYILPAFRGDVEKYPESAYKPTSAFTQQELDDVARTYVTQGIIKEIPNIANSVYRGK